MTKNVPIATSVVDTVRRHPAMLAQTALTVDHLSKGRFILGLGSGETENTVPYGFDFRQAGQPLRGSAARSSSCCGRAKARSISTGQFYKLEHARMDTDLYDGKCPPIWVGCSGPRMLDIAGRYADGWWPAGA